MSVTDVVAKYRGGGGNFWDGASLVGLAHSSRRSAGDSLSVRETTHVATLRLRLRAEFRSTDTRFPSSVFLSLTLLCALHHRYEDKSAILLRD